MKTQAQILEELANNKLRSNTIDGRDFVRLAEFFPEEDLVKFGVARPEGSTTPWQPKGWTEEEVKKQLAADVEFGFEKALNRRGISSSLMYECVKMWMWVLEDEELQDFDDYAQYGLPLFKAVAVKYNLPNPIGDDSGNEDKYAEESY